VSGREKPDPALAEGPAAPPRPDHLGHRARLRERFARAGGNALADYELLELVLCAVLPRADVKPLAKRLMARFGSVSGVLAAPLNALADVDGLGEVSAIYLSGIHALLLRAAREDIARKPVISSWQALLTYVKLDLQHAKREAFRVLFLDRKNQLIADETLGEGTVDATPVYPREVATRALSHAASAVILVHNHPSGDPTPSRADVEMTREIIAALNPLSISVHDHLVVGSTGVASFKSLGLL